MSPSVKHLNIIAWASSLGYILFAYIAVWDVVPEAGSTTLIVLGAGGALAMLALFIVLTRQRFKIETSLADASHAAENLSRDVKRFLDVVPLALLWIEPDGTIVRANRACAHLLEYSPQDLIHRKFGEVFAKLGEGAAVIQQVAADGLTREMTVKLKRKDSEPIEVVIQGEGIFGVSDLQHRLISLRDVTDRRVADTARKDAEGLFTGLAEHLNGFIWLSSLDMSSVYYISPSFKTMTGRPCGSVYDRAESLFASVHPGDRSQVTSGLKRLQLSGDFSEEFRIIETDGAVRWVEAHAFFLPGADGGPGKVCGFAIDITSCKEIERRGRAMHAITSTLSEAASIESACSRVINIFCEDLHWDLGIVWTVDRKSRLLRCRASWESPDLPGGDEYVVNTDIVIPPGRMLAGSVWQDGAPVWLPDRIADERFPRAGYVQSEDLRGVLSFPIKSSGDIVGVIELFRREVRPVDPSLLPLLQQAGNHLATFIEFKAAQIASFVSDLRLHLSLKNLSEVAVIELNEMGIIVDWSAGAANLLGYDSHEVIGHPIEFICPAEDLESTREPLLRSAETGVRHEHEAWMQKKDGSRIWSHIGATPMRDDQGNLRGYSLVAHQDADVQWVGTTPAGTHVPGTEASGAESTGGSSALASVKAPPAPASETIGKKAKQGP